MEVKKITATAGRSQANHKVDRVANPTATATKTDKDLKPQDQTSLMATATATKTDKDLKPKCPTSHMVTVTATARATATKTEEEPGPKCPTSHKATATAKKTEDQGPKCPTSHMVIARATAIATRTNQTDQRSQLSQCQSSAHKLSCPLFAHRLSYQLLFAHPLLPFQPSQRAPSPYKSLKARTDIAVLCTS